MRGATSGQLIVPVAEGLLQVWLENIKNHYIDVQSFDSLHFTATLLSDRDVLWSNPYAKEYSGIIITKYFELNIKKVNHDLQKWGFVDLNNQQQNQMDYGTCKRKKKAFI